jgi:glycine dehydrogenase
VDVGKKGLTAPAVAAAIAKEGMNVRVCDNTHIGLSFGETITKADLEALLRGFGCVGVNLDEVATHTQTSIPAELGRKTPFMTHPVFNSHQSETQMLRYLKKLENKVGVCGYVCVWIYKRERGRGRRGGGE